MFYRKVYPKAWQIAKKNPTTWFFGLFASFLGFYEIQVIFNFTDKFPDFISSNITSWVEFFITFSTINIGWQNLPDVLALFGLFILFSAVTILAVSSQAVLTHSADIKSKNTKNETLLERLKNGVDKFWPVFGLNVINSLIGYFFVSFVIAPIIYFLSHANNWPIYILISLFTFFVLVPLVVMISFVTRYGIAYIVIKNQKFSEAFVNSWMLFRVNWIITLENAVLLTILTFLSVIIILSSMVFVFVPLFIMSYLMPFLGIIIMLIAFFLMAIIFILGASIYTSFYNIVWASIFLELISPGKSHGKIHRLAHKHLPRLTQ